MSGTAAGTVVLHWHIAPETAILGGPYLVIVWTGDRVTIDAITRKFCVEIDYVRRDEGEIGGVEAGWGRVRAMRGLYKRSVLGAKRGGDLIFCVNSVLYLMRLNLVISYF